MYKDGVFFQNDVTASNMSILSRKYALDSERRVCELYELASDAADCAELLFKEGYKTYEVLGIIFEGLSFSADVKLDEAISENVFYISSYLNSVLTKDKAVFAVIFTAELKKRGIPVSETDFLNGDLGDETIVYVKNRLADEAYDVFSQEFSNPRVSYAQSFREAARAVSSGISEYCLLPLEEKGGARLSGIASLLFSEDLKINSVTPVFGMDGSADMKYALVSSHFTVPEFDEDDDRYLEIRISAKSSEELADLISVAESLSISVYRINTVTFETEDGDAPYFIAVLKSSGEDFSALLVYLTLFCTSYNAVGIYKNLE